jgi:hypothetical protein
MNSNLDDTGRLVFEWIGLGSMKVWRLSLLLNVQIEERIQWLTSENHSGCEIKIEFANKTNN